jgi:hypothetical protein
VPRHGGIEAREKRTSGRPASRPLAVRLESCPGIWRWRHSDSNPDQVGKCPGNSLQWTIHFVWVCPGFSKYEFPPSQILPGQLFKCGGMVAIMPGQLYTAGYPLPPCAGFLPGQLAPRSKVARALCSAAMAVQFHIHHSNHCPNTHPKPTPVV